jgi:hypothetical protein
MNKALFWIKYFVSIKSFLEQEKLLPRPAHRKRSTVYIRGSYISRRPSHGQFERRCCYQALLRIFSEVTYIRTVGNSTLLKIYTLPNHTITTGVYCVLWRLNSQAYNMGCGASFGQKWSMPWMSANI